MTTEATDTAVSGFSEEASVNVVVESFRDTADLRLRRVLTSLVSHLHAFVKEVYPTRTRQRGVDFLAAVGHMCDDTRQEFVLLFDVLGMSLLVDAVNNRKVEAATDSTRPGLGADRDRPAEPDDPGAHPPNASILMGRSVTAEEIAATAAFAVGLGLHLHQRFCLRRHGRARNLLTRRSGHQ